jgi:prephenate dehydrogenase
LGNDSATVSRRRLREAVMATRKKATGKTKAKRKKAAVKVSTPIRKTNTISKKLVKKAPLRGGIT